MRCDGHPETLQENLAPKPNRRIQTMNDFSIDNQGTIFLVQPNNEAAKQWLADNVEDGAQWFSSSLVVEHRYIQDLVAGMREAGFSVS